MSGREKKMRVVKRAALVDFWRLHPDAQPPLANWYARVVSRNWDSFAALKQGFSRSVDYVGGNRFVFDVGLFRLVVKMDFSDQIAFVRFVGTHAEYDRIKDITTI
ncbi:MAG: type II toxin-antitoxin system HigB family toxin [Desulfovibrionaceae bacterium]|nr:type II toxin-antitoxin system HigB family toxin [Desulfovibrionaceae bacterium]